MLQYSINYVIPSAAISYVQSWTAYFHNAIIKIPVTRVRGKIISFCNKPSVSGQQTAFYKTKLGVEDMEDIKGC